MTLGELKVKLATYGAREVGRSKTTTFGKKKPMVSIFYTRDKNVIYPFRLMTVATLALRSDSEDQKINQEQYLSLLRNLGIDKEE